MMRRAHIAAILTALLLTACESGDQQELRQWMQEESKDMRGKIPPLPEARPYEPVPYDAAALVEPFSAGKLAADRKTGGGGRQPDLNRPREPLEAYPLESLKYVGSMTRGGQTVAIIQVDGALHRVRAGNYLGMDFGRIEKITEMEINLKEFVQDSGGDWVERTSTLHLQATEGK